MTEPSTSETAYSDTQYDDNYPPGMEHHWWSRARAEIIQSALARLEPTRILDVGCGRGLTVAFLRQRGFECYGCELGRPSVDGVVVPYVSTGTAATDLDEGFRDRIDTILLLDVIEHIADPKAFLDDLLRAFPRAAHVVLTVPARQELWTIWDEHYGHFLRYDRSTLMALLSRTGLKVLSARHIFLSLYPILLLAARIGSRSKRATSPRRLWAHRIVASWFVAEAKVLAASPLWGTSLLAICKR
jgi:SAM-dependent methyltransferase